MNRRSFLGSIIGTVAGTNFFAKLFTEPPQRVILPYRIAFSGPDFDGVVQAPGVQQVIRDGKSFTWIAEPLQVTVPMNLNKLYLYNDKNQLLHTADFVGKYSANMYPGDTFKAQLTLTVDRFVSEKELVAKILAGEAHRVQ